MRSRASTTTQSTPDVLSGVRERLLEVADSLVALPELRVAAPEVVQGGRLHLPVAQRGEELPRLLVGRHRRVELAGLVLHDAEVHERDALGRPVAGLALDRQRALQIPGRLVGHVLARHDRRDVRVRLRLEERQVETLEGLGRGQVVRKRRLGVAQVEQAVREVVERDRAALLVARLRGVHERLLVGGDRLAVAALVRQHVADAVLGGRKTGVVARALAEVDRLLVRSERVVVPADRAVQVAEVRGDAPALLGVAARLVQRERALEQRLGNLIVAAQVMDDADRVEVRRARAVVAYPLGDRQAFGAVAQRCVLVGLPVRLRKRSERGGLLRRVARRARLALQRLDVGRRIRGASGARSDAERDQEDKKGGTLHGVRPGRGTAGKIL